ncbi:hypothetical protein D3C71_412410 [compost metagenome]
MKESKKYKRLKQFLFGTVVALLFLPMIQHKFRFFEEIPLKGSYQLSEKPKLNKETWFLGKYQEKQELYITEHTGFRPGWVRLYNQWNFTLFDKANASGVIVGKENYLYEENYIKAYYGLDFVGEKYVSETARKLKGIQDSLDQKGIKLAVIFAPGKASYLPEYIPNRYHQERKRSNYQEFKDQFDKYSVRHIDMHQWFESMKPTTKYPLFSKTGIHWTAYGQFLAIDSMTKYVSDACHCEIPSFVLDKMLVSNKPLLDDDDIGKVMNLLVDLPELKLAYPQFHPSRKTKKTDPKVLVIADSFYWGLFNANVSHFLFNEGEFWYYNEQIYPATFTKETLVKNQNMDRKLSENKVVFILITDANLHKFGFGFVDMAAKEYGIQ